MHLLCSYLFDQFSKVEIEPRTFYMLDKHSITEL